MMMMMMILRRRRRRRLRVLWYEEDAHKCESKEEKNERRVEVKEKKNAKVDDVAIKDFSLFSHLKTKGLLEFFFTSSFLCSSYFFSRLIIIFFLFTLSMSTMCHIILIHFIFVLL